MEKLINKLELNDKLKNLKKLLHGYASINILFLTFVITSVINSTLLRFFTVKNYFAISPILADTAIVILIGAFGYFIKPKHQFKYFFTWGVIFTALCVINSVYYSNYLSFVSFSLIETSLQVVSVGDAVTNIIEIKDFTFLWQVFALLFVNRVLKKKKYYDRVAKIEVGKVSAVNTMVAGLIIMCVFVSSLTATDFSRLNKQWNREYIVMKFGVYTYQINDLIATTKSQLNPLFGYDENAKAFREYYDDKDTTKQTNKYTNIFKGKNVITIHAESIQQFVIDASFNGVDVAPNLKKLASEGLYFSNFYSQESVGTSSDSEFTFNTSLMPASSGTVFVSYWDREYVSIPKLLKEQGYYTFSMHGNKGNFWNRNNAHKSLGYDNYYYYTKDFEIDETIGLGLSDKSFFRQAVPIISSIADTNEKFYGVLIMLTNHTPFVDIEEISDYEVTMEYTSYNEETGISETLVAPYLEGTKLGSYFKSVHYADEALGQFINDLDEAGLLDNTVLVIYGDHDAKLKRNEFVRYYNYVPETDSILDSDDPDYRAVDYYSYEINRKVPFIIWTKDKKYQEEITTVMGMYDVLPTLGNMFGFSSPYALGHDIFNVEDNVVVFPDGNWITDSMYYSQSKEEGKLINLNETVSVDYINRYNEIADEVVSISDSIIVYDLIRKTKELDELIAEE